MDAASHRTAEAQGREPVSTATESEPEVRGGGDSGLPALHGSRRVSVAEGYEHWAPIYDEVPNPLLAREERYLLPLLTDPANKSFLDLACGTGRWLQTVMRQGYKSGIGIDCSSAMLRVAGKKRAVKGRLAKADCENLPLRSAAFNLVICSFALGHIQFMGSMVRELARVTRTGANVFVSDLHPAAYSRGWRVGFRDRGTPIEIEMRPRATAEIVQAFCAGGFESQSQETLWLGEQERPLFDRAGKSHSFLDACRLPAVLVCHFRRIGSPDQRSAG